MFKVHVTTVALVGPVAAVDVQVILEGTLGSEGLQAHHALEGPDAHVTPDMSVEILFLRKCFAALQTQEEFVHFQMSEIVLKMQKSPRTLWTLVPPRIARILQALEPIHQTRSSFCVVTDKSLEVIS